MSRCLGTLGRLALPLCLAAGPLAAENALSIDIVGGEIVQVAALDTDAAPRMAGLGRVVGGDLDGGAVLQASLRAASLPAPSIILGLIAPGDEARFGVERLLPATVSALIFDLADLEARAALRSGQPDLFRRLVEEGHLDPADDDTRIRWLQTEMRRMECYTSSIDGKWGPGSRRSIPRYFAELDGVSWDGAAPTPELLREVMLRGDVDCPAQVANSSGNGNRSGGGNGGGGPAQQPMDKPAEDSTTPDTRSLLERAKELGLGRRF